MARFLACAEINIHRCAREFVPTIEQTGEYDVCCTSARSSGDKSTESDKAEIQG